MLGDVLIEGDLIRPPPPPPEPLPVAGLIDDDPVDPGLERRLAPEFVDGPENAEEDFLGEVERFVAVAQQVQREAVDHSLVTRHELGAGHFLTGGAALNQRSFTAGYLRPPECPCVLHQFRGDEPQPHGQFT
jgi:hypothetical protein